MLVAMHQPNFLPWLGFFYKFAVADLMVICDTLAFSKGSYTQRVNIKTCAGPRWLTLPVLHTGTVGEAILNLRCGGRPDWRLRLTEALRGNYLASAHYESFAREIGELILSSEDNLAQFNYCLIRYLSDKLNVQTPVTFSSSLHVPPQANATDWIIAVAKCVGADSFLSGSGGAKYQHEEGYSRDGVRLVYTDFTHPVYPQLHGEFVSGLSAVDLLFNCGPDAGAILRGSGTRGRQLTQPHGPGSTPGKADGMPV